MEIASNDKKPNRVLSKHYASLNCMGPNGNDASHGMHVWSHGHNSKTIYRSINLLTQSTIKTPDVTSLSSLYHNKACKNEKQVPGTPLWVKHGKLSSTAHC
jgi:hypothetical protein